MNVRRSLLGAVVVAAGLAAPTVAAADSIVFMQNGDVYSSRPDGSGKIQLTTGGNWHSPTQADDGTIAAVQGVGPIQVMAQDGRPLHTITTPNAATGNGGTFAGAPKSLAFTPDGTRIAYEYVQGSCPVASSCSTAQVSTFYTDNKAGDATPHSVWGNQFGVGDPEWITNDRALVHGGYGSQVSIDPLGGGDYSFTNWMNLGEDQGDGELSRDMKRLATTYLYGDNTVIRLFSVNGDPRTETPPAQPDLACELTPADAAYGDPSWSPDGSGLAIQTSKGVEVLRFTAFGPGSCPTGGRAVLADGATQPDWGPADPPASAWRPSTQPGQPDPGTGVVKPDPGKKPGAGALTVKAGGASRQRLRRGALTVTCTSPVAATCTATATVKVGRKAYKASAKSKVRKGRAAKLGLRFGKSAQRAIRKALRRGRLKATVRLTVTAGARKGTAVRTVTLLR